MPKMSAYVCSLFEGTYHLGLGALVNSLYRNGFRGTVFAGYRGALPPWANSTSTGSGTTDFDVGGGCRIRFLLLDTSLHLTSYKPIFMRQMFTEFLKDEDILCYFDPDITVKCRWSFFEEWVQNGLALVEDATFPYLPSDHPLRFQWMEIARSAQLTEKRSLSRYYNGGFVGVPGGCGRSWKFGNPCWKLPRCLDMTRLSWPARIGLHRGKRPIRIY